MSFNALISGADCGPVNPLAQMVKHAEADRSLQKDRIGASSSGSQLRYLPTSAPSSLSSGDMAMARQFFDNGAGPSMSAPLHVAPFQVPRPMAVPPPAASLTPVPRESSPALLNEAWSRGATSTNLMDGLQSAWNRAGSASPLPGAVTQVPATGHPLLGMPSMNPSFMPMMMRPSGPITLPQASQSPLHWDQEFSKVTSEDIKGKGKARLVEVDETSANGIEEAFKRLSAEEHSTTKEDFLSDFEKAWQELKGQAQDPSELAKWEAEYQQVLQARREEGEADYDFGTNMRNAWEQNQGRGLNPDFKDNTETQRPVYNASGEPFLTDYPFEPNNQYLALSGLELLAKAKEALANNGSLSEAALMFEAAIQKGDLGEGGYEAWVLLGEARGMDEREDIGLLALRQGVEAARKAGSVGPGMLSLAISYTNEGYELPATNILHEWLRARFPSKAIPALNPNQSLWFAREETTKAYIEVAQELHARGESDPDVQVGLGVLYYTDQEYEKAKDCFESALWVRPQDYLLWNRLGSCLSNDNKPEEALNVYREALRLRPTYTRAIFNVGVACLNIGAYKEAAEHFLSALSAQRTTSGGPARNPSSEDNSNEQTWKTLRKTFNLMERQDLVDLSAAGDVDAFRSQGFDF